MGHQSYGKERWHEEAVASRRGKYLPSGAGARGWIDRRESGSRGQQQGETTASSAGRSREDQAAAEPVAGRSHGPKEFPGPRVLLRSCLRSGGKPDRARKGRRQSVARAGKRMAQREMPGPRFSESCSENPREAPSHSRRPTACSPPMFFSSRCSRLPHLLTEVPAASDRAAPFPHSFSPRFRPQHPHRQLGSQMCRPRC